MTEKVKHYGFNKVQGVCGYNSKNLTKNKKDITCKLCKSELRRISKHK